MSWDPILKLKLLNFKLVGLIKNARDLQKLNANAQRPLKNTIQTYTKSLHAKNFIAQLAYINISNENAWV